MDQQEKIQQLENQLETLTAKLEALQNKSPDQWQDIARKAGSETRVFINKLEQAGEENLEELFGYVKQKPLQSLGLAFLVGVIFSYIFGRRS